MCMFLFWSADIICSTTKVDIIRIKTDKKVKNKKNRAALVLFLTKNCL